VLRYTPPEDDAHVLLIGHGRTASEPPPAIGILITTKRRSVEFAVDELVITRRDGATALVLVRWGTDPYYSENTLDDSTLGTLARRIVRGLPAARAAVERRTARLTLLRATIRDRDANRRTVGQAEVVAATPGATERTTREDLGAWWAENYPGRTIPPSSGGGAWRHFVAVALGKRLD
jgi:hypothetical protein